MAKTPRPWTVIPHGPLEQLEDNLWVVESPVPGPSGLDRRMSIVRLSDGRLLFHNAVPLDEPTLDALTRYGHHLGLCFQIIDDVLDLTADDETLGKPAGQDLVEGIYTLPVIYALAEDATLADCLGGPLDTERRDEVRRRTAATGAVDAALAIARDHATKASEALAGADRLDATVAERLRKLVDGLVDRDR